MKVPENYADLFAVENKAIAYLALVKKDGAPHVTPIWFEYDGQNIVINTARGRVKDKILRKHPQVALAISDPHDPYRYCQVRGQVVEETEVGAFDVICRLNNKYHGDLNYPKRPGEVRVTYKIRPDLFSPK